MENAKPPRLNGAGNGGKRLTRKRIPLSCVACRIRKLKCNREKPCQNCIVRGESTAASCTYVEKVERKHSSKSNPRSDAEDMRKRINRLESSILSMMSSDGRNGTQKPAIDVSIEGPVDEDEVPDQGGGQKISLDSRSTHWNAILNELGAMKEAWSEENDQTKLSNGYSVNNPRPHRQNLLTGFTLPPGRSTMLASLPPKDQTDRLVTRFFDYYTPAMPARYLLHRETFMKEYNKHWEDPTKTKMIWIGLLFSILCHAMQGYRRNHEEAPDYPGTSAEVSETFRIRTGQCITIANYTKPSKYMVETMLLYSMTEYSDERDGDAASWFLCGTLTRTALQQGYHRDPSLYPDISVFDGEMRRRVWIMLTQFELLLCVQIGLPKTVRYSETDVASARNLYDHEIHEGMKVLPLSRPLTEETPSMSYFVVKARVMYVYGIVVETLHVLQPQSYQEIMRLDKLLLETQDMIPSYLQVRPLEEMMKDPPSRLLERYYLQIFLYKANCLLHRKHWTTKPDDAAPECSFFYSRKTCVDSSLMLLDIQASMHRACRPGGPLFRNKWYHFSLTNHDFLLAAMILCLDLMGTSSKSEPVLDCIIPELEKFDSIKQSRAIWAEVLDDCKDAGRAINILDRVIRKLTVRMDEMKTISQSQRSPGDFAVSASATNPNADMLRYSPYFTDQFGLGIPSIADPPLAEDTPMQDRLLSSGGLLDSLGTDINLPADFDWDAWDQLMATQPLDNGMPIML